MWSRTVPLLLTTLAFAGCATSSGNASFATADRNADDLVSQAEFADYMAGLNNFATYDTNGDGTLTQAEYRSSVNAAISGDAYFRGFDRDHSGTLTREEYVNGIFASYDRNGDGWLDRSEFLGASGGVVIVTP